MVRKENKVNNDLYVKDIKTISKMIQDGEITSYELITNIINKINDHNKKYNSFITILENQAISKAKTLDNDLRNGKYRGELHGIPVALKDNIFYNNVRTTMGSKVYENFIAKKDAHIVKLLEEAGAIIIGKLNTHEFAYGTTGDKSMFGPVKNYYDVNLVPGGSSSGSAVSVAGVHCLATIGTDTGGSVRIPAAFNKVVGLKPTFGRVSKSGVYPLCDSLDHVGPLTQSVFDNALVMNAIAGYDTTDPNSLSVDEEDFTELIGNKINGIRIGIPTNDYFKNMDDIVKKEYESVVGKLKEHGALVTYISIKDLDELNRSFWITLASEGYYCHKETVEKNSNKMDVEVVDRIQSGANISAFEYIKAQHLKQEYKEYFEELFHSIDIILTPTVPIVPPKTGESTVRIKSEDIQLKHVLNKFTGITNFVGLPSLSMPASQDPKLLVGIQLIGNYLQEALIYQVAGFIEELNKQK